MKSISRRQLLAAGTALPLVASSPVRAAEPVRIGASLSLTGRFSDSAKYTQEGYLLWVAQVNEAGGLNGSKVELTIYDDESNPDTGRVLAQRLIDRDGVIAILGPYSSPITDAEAVVAERAQVPLLGTIASDSSIWTRRKLHWSFQAFPSSDYDHQGFIDIIRPRIAEVKKIAVIFEEAPFSIASKDHALTELKESGFEVEAYGYAPGAQDFRSIIERMVNFGASAVSMGGYYQPSIALTRQMMERGFNPVAYNFIQAADGVTKDALGANANGIFGRSAWEATIDTPASRAFVAAYEAKYQRTPAYHSAAAYSSGQVYAAAIKAKGVDKSAIREFVASTPVETVLGTFRVNAQGQQTGYRYVATQWQDGKSLVVGGNSKTAIIWPKPKWV